MKAETPPYLKYIDRIPEGRPFFAVRLESDQTYALYEG
jgi:hypothetical protein